MKHSDEATERFLNEYELHKLAVLNYIEFHESLENKARGLKALGILPDFEKVSEREFAKLVHKKLQEQEDAIYENPCDNFIVLQKNRLKTIEYNIALAHKREKLKWKLQSLSGEIFEGEINAGEGRQVYDFEGRPMQRSFRDIIYSKMAFDLPDEVLNKMSFGDYRFEVKVPGRETFTADLVYAPEKCYQMPGSEDKKFRGTSVSLFGLRSAENLGVGNYGDLAEFSHIAAQNNLDIVGTLPLHALQHTLPESASPYSPISRTFFNFLYLDVTAIPEFEKSSDAKNMYYSKEFTDKRRRNQNSSLVDYTTSYELLMPLLEKVYDTFLKESSKERKAEFDVFKREKGDNLYKFALFQALSEHFADKNSIYDWRKWPEEYQNPNSQEVRAFWAANKKRVDFFAYLQWETAKQLNNVQKVCRQEGMKIGLYTDLAVGTVPNGFEAWADRGLYMRGSLGIAPDMCSSEGQNWGIIGYNPISLERSGFKPFREMLDSNMLGGMMRIDCPLCGLYTANLIPEGKTPKEAFKIYMPTDKMLALIALSSHKNKTPVVFEDLGAIPWHFRAKIEALGGITYKVLSYERCSLRDLPKNSLVVSSTHDSETQNVGWKGISAYILENHNCLPSKYVNNYLRDAYEYRRYICGLLKAEKIADFNPDNNANVPEGYYKAIAELMGNNEHCNSTYGIMPIADILGLPRWRENLPGTAEMHASKSKDAVSIYTGEGNILPNTNWRLKLPLYLNELAINPRLKEVTTALSNNPEKRNTDFERFGVREKPIRDPERFVKIYTLLAEKERWLVSHGKSRFSGKAAYDIWKARFSARRQAELQKNAVKQAENYRQRCLSAKQNKR